MLFVNAKTKSITTQYMYTHKSIHKLQSHRQLTIFIHITTKLHSIITITDDYIYTKNAPYNAYLTKNQKYHHTYTYRKIESTIVWQYRQQHILSISIPNKQKSITLAKGRTNIELREQFILADGVSQSMAAFKPRMSSAGSTQNGSHASSPISTQGPITKVNVLKCLNKCPF